jgi:hypothetical protein
MSSARNTRSEAGSRSICCRDSPDRTIGLRTQSIPRLGRRSLVGSRRRGFSRAGIGTRLALPGNVKCAHAMHGVCARRGSPDTDGVLDRRSRVFIIDLGWDGILACRVRSEGRRLRSCIWAGSGDPRPALKRIWAGSGDPRPALKRIWAGSGDRAPSLNSARTEAHPPGLEPSGTAWNRTRGTNEPTSDRFQSERSLGEKMTVRPSTRKRRLDEEISGNRSRRSRRAWPRATTPRSVPPASVPTISQTPRKAFLILQIGDEDPRESGESAKKRQKAPPFPTSITIDSLGVARTSRL